MTTFLDRAVHYLAGEVGIDQFIAIGRGLVAMENVHQVAQWSFPRARVVYVDNDPAAVPRAEALLMATTGVCVISEDVERRHAGLCYLCRHGHVTPGTASFHTESDG